MKTQEISAEKQTEKESNGKSRTGRKKRKPTKQNKPNNPTPEIRKSLDVLKRKWR